MSTEGDSKAGGKISARDAGLVSAAVMCSRVLGLVRELIFAKLFGAGFAMDAFVAAFRLPRASMLRLTMRSKNSGFCQGLVLLVSRVLRMFSFCLPG